MDQITPIEDALLLQMQTVLRNTPGLAAAALPFPDKKFEEYEPMHPNGEILVMYTGEDDGETEATDIVLQPREMTWELTFLFSSLRPTGETGGLYAHLEAIREGLTGFQPDICTRKTTLDGVERVQRYKKRWWQYRQTWRFTALNIEVVPDDTSPLATRITLIGPGGQSTEVP